MRNSLTTFVLKEYPALDGIRGLAIVFVMLAHFGLSPSGMPQLFPQGVLGVDVFLILSGFLIVSAILRDYYQTGRVQFIKFYKRRAARILPALSLLLFSAGVISFLRPDLLDPNAVWMATKGALTFTLNFSMILNCRFCNPLSSLWSLSVEEQFYLILLFEIDLRMLAAADFVALRLLGFFIAWFLTTQAFEFFYYWFHRAQHTFPLLWRFHAIHHSLEEMSAFNSNHDFTEEIFRVFFVIISTSLIFSFQGPYAPFILASLLASQGIYEHSCTRRNFGIFRYIVPDNRYHRIHHSTEKKHFNRNFGSATALWDMVFRTAYFPGTDEWPKVGLKGQPEPGTLTEFPFRPFRTK